jgi:hypothetical protein
MLRRSLALAFGLAASKPASQSRRTCDQGKSTLWPTLRPGELALVALVSPEPGSARSRHRTGRVVKRARLPSLCDVKPAYLQTSRSQTRKCELRVTRGREDALAAASDTSTTNTAVKCENSSHFLWT